jgi:hypothetical protein
VYVFGKHPTRSINEREQLSALGAQSFGMLFDNLASLFEGNNEGLSERRHFENSGFCHLPGSRTRTETLETLQSTSSTS